eukprot:TRINITY_DN3959_c0_g1_i1.p1 TRINITY_DN3959_c0_g1~~TRINITY_DN3959_c0_g1_i1.p1  ORF type:complete len:468 (-),score=152.33 TRINITY_DN3959_c0_g1_i1:184-1554(-)
MAGFNVARLLAWLMMVALTVAVVSVVATDDADDDEFADFSVTDATDDDDASAHEGTQASPPSTTGGGGGAGGDKDASRKFHSRNEAQEQENEFVLSDFDEDEFVVSAPPPSKKGNKKASTRTVVDASVATEAKKDVEVVPPAPRDFYVEMACAPILLIFIVNYFIGGRANGLIAKQWHATIRPILMSQFHIVDKLLKETMCNYTMLASGRINCAGVQSSLDLTRRHDLFFVLGSMVWPTKDTWIVDVPMDDDASDPFVFALVRKEDLVQMRTDNPDLAQCDVMVCPVPGFSLLTDSDEVPPLIFKVEEVMITLKKYADHIQLIHFTDQSSHEKHKRSLRFIFTLPFEGETKEERELFVSTLCKMCIFLIDTVARVHLSKSALQKIKGKRAEGAQAKQKATHASRQEAAQQRKDDELRKRKEKYDLMSSADQAKEDERNRKKEMKRMMKGRTKIARM